jgi:hypothetical protein
MQIATDDIAAAGRHMVLLLLSWVALLTRTQLRWCASEKEALVHRLAREAINDLSLTDG